MPRIPLYQQGNIASSAVGTPGVDASGAKTWAAAANAADSVATSAYAELNANRMAAKQAQEKVDAAAKVLQTAEMATEVNRRKMAYKGALAQVQTNIHANSQFDTSSTLNDVSAAAKSLQSQFVDDIQNPLLKTKVQEALDTEAGSAIDQTNTFVAGRRIPVIQANVRATAAGLQTLLGDSRQTWDQVHQSVNQYVQDNHENYKLLYGPEADAQMHEDISEAVKSRLADVANQGDPAALEQEIGHFKGVVDPEKAHVFLNQQRQIAAMQERIQNHQTVLNQQAADLGAVASVTSADVGTRPEAIKKALEDPNLSPTMRESLTAKLTPAKIKAEAMQDDSIGIRALGAMGQESNGLYQRMIELEVQHNMQVRHNPAAAKKTLLEMQAVASRYGALHDGMASLRDNLSSAKAQKAATDFISRKNAEMNSLAGQLAKNPTAIQYAALHTKYLNTIGAPPSPYPTHPQMQKTFEYYFRQAIENNIDRSRAAGTFDKNLADPKVMSQIRMNAINYANIMTQRAGFSSGR